MADPLNPQSASHPTVAVPAPAATKNQKAQIKYVQYDPSHEAEYVSAIRQLISQDLSEPYSIYVYRYFLYQWGELCFMAMDPSTNTLIGVVVSKLEIHRGGPLRGYIAMLAVRSSHRGQGIATKLVRMAIDAMISRDADEIALETELSNTPAINLYQRLGFLRSKRLHRYYLNGNSAYRLVLYLKEGTAMIPTGADVAGLYNDDQDRREEDDEGDDEEEEYIGDLPEEWTRGMKTQTQTQTQTQTWTGAHGQGEKDKERDGGGGGGGGGERIGADDLIKRDEVQAV